jgi:hypothetical protein
MADITETVPFNFDELYNGLKTKFEEKGYDTEEGSNTSQLITAMAYLTSMLNVNTAVNINETILPLATKRNNALQDARALGYEIQHKQSYSYRLTLALTAGNHTIPKYSVFTAGAKTYYYMGKQIDITDWNAGNTIEIPVIEGTLHKYTDDPALTTTIINVVDDSGVTVPQYYIDVPYADVEESGIEVFVTYYDDYGNLVSKERWYRSDHFMIDADTELNKQFVRLDNIEYRTPRIYFTLAGVGQGVRLGSIVEMNVLTTTATEGAIDDLTAVESITHSIDGATVTNIILINEGAEEETIESIQLNAPKFYNSANRAVTKTDYEAICNRQSSVQTSLAWGGDDEFPKCPGHIWFSYLPKTKINRTFSSDTFNYEYLLDSWGDLSWDYTLDSETDETAWNAQWATNEVFYNQRFIQDSEIKSYEYTADGQLIQPGIWDVLDNYKIPTLEFHHRHPMFLDFEYDVNIVRYNITDSKATIHQQVFDTIDGFFTGTNDSIKMEQFETEYFHSSLEKRIDTVLTDNTGYTNSVMARLLLTKKNVAKENYLAEYRDIYIPMSIPFETYFSADGYLLHNKLPKIDTTGFIDYDDGFAYDVYTDWSNVDADIANNIKQTSKDVIVAPIRTTMEESKTISVALETNIEFDRIVVLPDDATTLDDIAPEFTFAKTDVYYSRKLPAAIEVQRINMASYSYGISNLTWTLTVGSVVLSVTSSQMPPAPTWTLANLVNGLIADADYAAAPFTIAVNGTNIDITWKTTGPVTTVGTISDSNHTTSAYTVTTGKNVSYSTETKLTYNEPGGWGFDPLHTDRIALLLTPTVGDIVRVVTKPSIGMYHLFNSYKKYIIVQFYVNAVGYSEGSTVTLEYDSPKSYLTTTDGFYDYTTDNYYLTTEGYSIINEDQLNATTGTIVKKISPSTYVNSPLKMSLFRKNRYLNFDYNTKNFAVLKNVIPRLKRVTFSQGA